MTAFLFMINIIHNANIKRICDCSLFLMSCLLSCSRALLLAQESTLWPCTAVWSFSVGSCSTTPRRSSTEPRIIPFGESRNTTPLTTALASTPTPSTSSSGSPRSLPCKEEAEENRRTKKNFVKGKWQQIQDNFHYLLGNYFKVFFSSSLWTS